MSIITQRLRWIPAGKFLMGSPRGEPGRSDAETPHLVTLSQGYWLADTACTQALWAAVAGNNPSCFQDPAKPVEMISWYDAQEFIAQLNKAVPGLQARLPSEAEWECACRAGTMTPFSFGDNISPEQVNYDGNYPYHDAAKGEYRQTTVAVKSLPPNPWGLYEMHGNVWEWCADWYGAYPAGAATNPHGPDSDGYRVLRGGSWFFSGRRARSASRYWNAPGRRYDFFGFRLARGQEPGEAELGPGPGWGTPTWANATGKDKFGYWAEFYI